MFYFDWHCSRHSTENYLPELVKLTMMKVDLPVGVSASTLSKDSGQLPSIKLLTMELFCISSEYLEMSYHKMSLLKEKYLRRFARKTSQPSRFSTAFLIIANTLGTSTPKSSIGRFSKALRFKLYSCLRYSINVMLIIVSSSLLFNVYFVLTDFRDSSTN